VEKFAGYDAQVVGMSVDSIPSHIAWQKKDIGWVSFPLGSDFWPHGEVAIQEGDPLPGISERAVFIIDKQGVIAFAKVYPLDKPPENEELFEVLRGLNKKE
jgi:alkyl hydroperoxide reductase subunit AhpC